MHRLLALVLIVGLSACASDVDERDTREPQDRPDAVAPAGGGAAASPYLLNTAELFAPGSQAIGAPAPGDPSAPVVPARWIPPPSRAWPPAGAEVDPSRINVFLQTQCAALPSFTDVVLIGADGTERAPDKGYSRGSAEFGHIPDGEYTVVVRDPRFAPWSQSGVRPGARIQATLIGTAAISVEVFDRVTNEPLREFDAWVSYDFERIDARTGAKLPPNTHVCSLPSEVPSSAGPVVFEGMVPNKMTVFVKAQGYVHRGVEVLGVQPHENRSLELRLVRPRPLDGVVRDAASGQPVAGAKIVIGPRREPGEPGESAWNPDRCAFETTSDASGRFHFDTIYPGTHLVEVLAEELNYASTQVVVSADVDPAPVVVELGATSRLVGRILTPAGASLAGVRASIAPFRKVDRPANVIVPPLFSLERTVVSVEADGSFRSPVLPVGPVAVALFWPYATTTTASHASNLGVPSFVFDPVTLEAGTESRHAFDLRADFPVSVTVRVLVDGAPAAGLELGLHMHEPRPKDDPASIAGHRPDLGRDVRSSWGGVTGSDGVLRLDAVSLGSYELEAGPLDRAWLYTDPRRIEVRSGTSPTIEVDVRLCEGALTLLDIRDGKPVAGKKIALCMQNALPLPSVEAQTDENGVLKLCLPAGRWLASSCCLPSSAPGMPEGAFAAFDWGPQGPSPAVHEIVVSRW